MTKLAKKNTRGYLVCLVKLTAQKSRTPSFSPSLKKGTTMTKDCNYDKATGKTAIGLSLGVIFKTNPKRTHRGWRSWGTKSHLHHWNNSRKSFWVMWATGRLIFLQQHLITEVHPKAPNTSCTPHLRSIPAHPPTTTTPPHLGIQAGSMLPLGVPEGHETKEAAMNFPSVKGWTGAQFPGKVTSLAKLILKWKHQFLFTNPVWQISSQEVILCNGGNSWEMSDTTARVEQPERWGIKYEAFVLFLFHFPVTTTAALYLHNVVIIKT